MAKPLVFQIGDDEIGLTMNKVDRSRLYGFKEIEAIDEHDEVCELATLADDGRTIIGRGGTGFAWLDADGQWCDKSKLKPVNVDGDEIKPVGSSFSAPIKLFDTATVDEYLQHNIRLVYALTNNQEEPEGNPAWRALRDELGRGTIFAFPYSYRGGLEADAAFLLQNDEGEVMLAVGNPTEVAFVGIQTLANPVDDEEESSDDPDAMDFDMI